MGVLATLIVTIIGSLVGAIAGFYGGWLDAVLSRITDIFFAVPLVLAAIVVMQLFKEHRNILVVAIVLGAFGWVSIARITRGAVLSVKNDEFVQAARSVGASNGHILFSHIMPNAAAPILSLIHI